MRIKIKLIFLLLFFLCNNIFAQEIQRKKVTALRIDQPLKIDAILDEQAYSQVEPAKDFVQLMPYNGQPSYQPTEVRIFFDDNAIYFGAMLYDNPDSITSYITTRDDLGVADYFDVFIDPNNEGLTAYEFAVTPANSQTDIKAVKTSYDNKDGSWDAVWQSATKINEKGWSIEIRIPYSALRFPAKENPVWGLNFFRLIRRYNSNNSWNFINFSIDGFIQQSGELTGLKNIKAPVRLSLSPYVAGYLEKNSDATESSFRFKGGLDLKYGISESHTLDMMLIPDFGQIQSDDNQLNLTPYELYYDEKRQFFVEGTELFNRAGIFYSRRIGGMPKFNDLSGEVKENEVVKYNPAETQIINATKISGRDKNGWGVGFLNAMTLAGKAEILDTLTGITREVITQNFTNYNVSIVEKAMANNSYMSLINSNVSILDNPYMANVTGTEFMFKNKSQNYQISGSGAVSYKSMEEKKFGFKYNVGLQKVKGKFRFIVEQTVNSDTYDNNDLGYLKRNNDILNLAQISYNIYDPFWIFKNWYAQINFQNTRLYKPSKHIQNEGHIWSEATFRNNWWAAFYVAYNFGNNDYYEPRVENRFYKTPSYVSGEFNFNSDQNKKLSLSGNIEFYQASLYPEVNGLWSYLSVWWKATQRFGIYYQFSTSQDRNLKRYVNHINENEIYFGNYDRYTYINTLSTGYNFSTKISLNLRCRHYWSWAEYDDYFFLNNDGNLKEVSLPNTNANVNYNTFNVDMTFKWEFAPGSELSVAWKNAIYTENKNMNMNYVNNIKETFLSSQTNSLSVKILYYIDYNTLKKKKA